MRYTVLRGLVTLAVVASSGLALASCSSSGSGASGSASSPAAHGGTSSAASPTAAGQSGSNASVKLAGVVASATDPYWITVMCGGTKEAKALGVQLKWFTSPTTSTQSMSQDFDSALLTKPQGMYINPFQATQFSSQVKNLMGQGVPVITSTPLQPVTQYATTDINTNGTNYTAQVLKILPSGSGKIVALGGIPGIQVITDEWKPMEDAIVKQRPDIKVLPTQYTNFDVTKSTQIVSSLLLSHPDLKLIIASTGPEGEGAAAAVKQAGKVGKVAIWAYDATPAEVQFLKQGVITALAAKPAEAVGKEAVDELVKTARANGSKPLTPKNNLPALPVTIITKETVDSPSAQGSLYKSNCSA